jgi:hypothetical protein
MSSLFGSTPKMPPSPAVPQPKQEDRAMDNAANAERLRRAGAFGRQDTTLNQMFPGGGAQIVRKSLLGG